VHVKSYGQYLILGDDIVIKGEKLANSYMGLLEDLEISFNKEDSYVWTKTNTTAEFAKRIFRNGIDLSPLPSRLLEGTFLDQISFFIESLRRDYHPDDIFLSRYPGTENGLSALMLTVYLFIRIDRHLTFSDTFKRINQDD
jgi:hypothetical protein